jgi:hypothetical protein
MPQACLVTLAPAPYKSRAAAGTSLSQLECPPKQNVARRPPDLDLEAPRLDTPVVLGGIPVGEVAVFQREGKVRRLTRSQPDRGETFQLTRRARNGGLQIRKVDLDYFLAGSRSGVLQLDVDLQRLAVRQAVGSHG